MTGIERLRDFARHMKYFSVWPGGQKLLDIAEQIERERGDAETWVREHGGLDRVKAEWCSRVPYDKHEQRRQRLLDHIAECETALGRRNARIEGLDHHVSDLKRENAELRRRAMPEGMEWLVDAWPRFEDGAPVAFLDEVQKNGEDFGISTVTLYNGGDFSINFRTYPSGERVKRPAPKVLDADGVEIELGDDLYSVEGGLKLHVGSIDTCNGKIATSEMYALDKWADPAMYTHRAPVIAADGKPLREGETVYFTPSWMDGESTVVERLEAIDGAVKVWFTDGEYDWPKNLTHERPDSWEKWSEDEKLRPIDYCVIIGHPPSEEESAELIKNRDLVRRVKALAERGQ